MSIHEEFMQLAIDLSVESVKNNGGPFGAVIVKAGKIIAKSSNSVTVDNDPTAHAEVNTIRKAAKALNTFDLSGCTIYTSCEPCPMCLGAIYWSRIDKIYFANTKLDAKEIGFDDSFIYDEIDKPYKNRTVETVQILRDKALIAFQNWSQKTDKTEY